MEYVFAPIWALTIIGVLVFIFGVFLGKFSK